MLLFLFLLFPVVLIGYCFYKPTAINFISIFIGLLSAVLICAFKTFFLYAHRVIPYSFADNMVYLLIRQTLLPALVLCGVFIAFSKDTLDYKIKSICPLLLSFYMVYLPYSVVSTSEGLYSAYGIFAKPLIYVFMILQISYCAEGIFNGINSRNKVFIVIYSFIILVYLFIPAIIESLSLINEMTALQVILAVVYCLVPVVLELLPKFIKK